MNSGEEIAKVLYSGAHRILISAYHEFLVIQYVPWIMHMACVLLCFVVSYEVLEFQFKYSVDTCLACTGQSTS